MKKTFRAFEEVAAMRTMKTNDNYTQKRKKVWQVAGTYHCSLMGICFGRKELQKFKTKKLFDFDRAHSDYYVHNRLSALSSQKNPQSRAIHKELDTRYRLAVKRYGLLQSVDELIGQWEQDFKEGRAAGAYWALMTHPLTDRNVIERIYGDCHMAGFDCFTEQRREAAVLGKFREENTTLKKQLEQKQAEVTDLKEKRSMELGIIKQEKSELIRQRLENDRLREVNRELQVKAAGKTTASEMYELKETLERSEQENSSLRKQVEKLHLECNRLQESQTLLENMAIEKEEELQVVKRQSYEQQVELDTLEKMMVDGLDDDMDCENCTEQCTCPMSSGGLGGKTVLYVGGQRKMISHYRQIVESCGGEFLYHDGGKESSRHQLPKMLTGADAVFCPIDCVSHDACKCVKKICKRYQKTFVMMRSSGLSSLAKGLESIRQ